jgi:hypothetical protein
MDHGGHGGKRTKGWIHRKREKYNFCHERALKEHKRKKAMKKIWNAWARKGED